MWFIKIPNGDCVNQNVMQSKIEQTCELCHFVCVCVYVILCGCSCGCRICYIAGEVFVTVEMSIDNNNDDENNNISMVEIGWLVEVVF